MIRNQIAVIVAPWCLVLLVAIGCSKHKEDSAKADSTPSAQEPLSAVSVNEEKSRPPEESGEDQYRKIVESEQDPVRLRSALTPFYETWGARDGSAAVEHALAQNRTFVKDAFVGWLVADAQAPREWVLSQTGSERRRAGLAAGLLHALPVEEHVVRGEWAAKFAESLSGARLVSEVAIGWGKERPQEALQWLSELPAGSARSGGIEAVFQRWTAADPELASSHLTRMPDSDAKNLAISSLAKAIHRTDPDAARLWVETITDANLREVTNGLLNKLAASGGGIVPGS